MLKNMSIGAWSFMGLLVLILILSLVPDVLGVMGPFLAVILAGAVALLNITKKETMKTMVAAVVLALGGMTSIVTAVQVLPEAGVIIGSILSNVGTYFLAIGIFVALKVYFKSAKD